MSKRKKNGVNESTLGVLGLFWINVLLIPTVNVQVCGVLVENQNVSNLCDWAWKPRTTVTKE